MWDTEYSEDLIVPVPDLYPELSDSLPNMQESDTEQGEMTKGDIHSFALAFIHSFIHSFLLVLDESSIH